jgi:hypothetical protein
LDITQSTFRLTQQRGRPEVLPILEEAHALKTERRAKAKEATQRALPVHLLESKTLKDGFTVISVLPRSPLVWLDRDAVVSAGASFDEELVKDCLMLAGLRGAVLAILSAEAGADGPRSEVERAGRSPVGLRRPGFIKRRTTQMWKL